MASENILIKQDTNMRVNGRTTWQMEGDRQSMLMKANIMENLLTIKDMEMES